MCERTNKYFSKMSKEIGLFKESIEPILIGNDSICAFCENHKRFLPILGNDISRDIKMIPISLICQTAEFSKKQTDHIFNIKSLNNYEVKTCITDLIHRKLSDQETLSKFDSEMSMADDLNSENLTKNFSCNQSCCKRFSFSAEDIYSDFIIAVNNFFLSGYFICRENLVRSFPQTKTQYIKSANEIIAERDEETEQAINRYRQNNSFMKEVSRAISSDEAKFVVNGCKEYDEAAQNFCFFGIFPVNTQRSNSVDVNLSFCHTTVRPPPGFSPKPVIFTSTPIKNGSFPLPTSSFIQLHTAKYRGVIQSPANQKIGGTSCGNLIQNHHFMPQYSPQNCNASPFLCIQRPAFALNLIPKLPSTSTTISTKSVHASGGAFKGNHIKTENFHQQNLQNYNCITGVSLNNSTDDFLFSEQTLKRQETNNGTDRKSCLPK